MRENGAMRSPRRTAVLVASLGVALLAGCGESGGKGTRTTAAPERLHIYSDLPMRPPTQSETQAMVDAIHLVVDDRQEAAGDYAVSYRERDDSDPQTGAPDPAICAANARHYAADP